MFTRNQNAGSPADGAFVSVLRLPAAPSDWPDSIRPSSAVIWLAGRIRLLDNRKFPRESNATVTQAAAPGCPNAIAECPDPRYLPIQSVAAADSAPGAPPR